MTSFKYIVALSSLTALITFPLSASAESPRTESPLTECDPNVVHRRAPDWLPGIMKTKPVLRDVMKRGHSLRFQMVVAEVIQRDTHEDCLRITRYRHAAEYTYPASSIKMVGAIGAVRIMQETPGWELDTPIRIAPLKRTFEDTEFEVSPGKESTMQELLDDTLIVSSNLAFNSLYDIAGRAYLDDLMIDAGLDSVRLWHRLSQTTAPKPAHAWAPRVEISASDEWREVRPVRGPAPSLEPHVTPRTQLGVAYVEPGSGLRVEEPMDFSQKNGVTMFDLLTMTVAVARPDLTANERPFGLADTSRAALRASMAKRPAAKTEEEVLALEARFKPLSPGVVRAFAGDRARFEYVNKAGRAYGFHLDSAFVHDEQTGRSFFVAVTLWPNENQVLNDNEYEYDDLSYPAFSALGEVLTRSLILRQ